MSDTGFPDRGSLFRYFISNHLRDEEPRDLSNPFAFVDLLRLSAMTRRFAWIASDGRHSRETVTCPVPFRPIARAAAGDRSISLPRTQGPVNANCDASTMTDANPRAKWQSAMSRCHCRAIYSPSTGCATSAITVASAVDACHLCMRSAHKQD